MIDNASLPTREGESVMSVLQFERDQMAGWYAKRHLQTDLGIAAVHYLPAGAPEREIRLLEVNELMSVRDNDPLEPIDFGVAVDGPDAHTLMVLDVTPAQWERIRTGQLRLPDGWSLEGAIPFARDRA